MGRTNKHSGFLSTELHSENADVQNKGLICGLIAQVPFGV